MVVDPIPTENRQTRKVGWRAVGVAAFALGLLLQTVPAGALGRSISISSPPPGDLVSGPVPIVVDALGTDVDWINVTVDDDYIGSSPPYMPAECIESPPLPIAHRGKFRVGRYDGSEFRIQP